MASLSLPRVLQLKKNSLDAEREQFEKFQSLAIHKAINSNETPVKEKHVRSTIIGTFQEQSAITYWMVAIRLPLQDNRIAAWKFCHVTHKLLREGHPACLDDSQRHIGMIENLGKLWVHLREGYGRLISLYTSLLVTKLKFHARNPRFPGNMQLTADELDNIAENDVNNYFQLCVELFDYMDDILNLQAAVFDSLGNARANSMTASGQCRLAALIPCAQDSSHIYDCNVRLLFRLHASLPPDTLSGHRERFRQQFKKLSSFYKHASSLQYYRNLLTLPVLPSNPPNFLLQSDFGTYVAPVVSVPDPPPDDTDAVGALIDTSDTISQATTPDQLDGFDTRATPSPQPDPLVERDRLIDHLQNELKRMRSEASQLVQERNTMLSSMREHCTRLETQLQSAKSELEEEKQKAEVLSVETPEIKQKLVETEEKAKVADEKFQKLKGAYTNLREEHINLIRQKAEVDKTTACLRAAAAQHESAKAALQQQLNDRMKDVELLQQSASSSEEIEAYKSELSNLRTELEQSRQKELELETLRASMEALDIEHKTAAAEQHDKLTTVTNELKEVSETLEKIKQEKEERESELSRVKVELVGLREKSGEEYKRVVEEKDAALKQVMELTQQHQQEKEEQNLQIINLREELDVVKHNLNDKENALEKVEKELTKYQETIFTKDNELITSIEKLKELQSQIDAHVVSLDENENKIHNLQDSVNKLEEIKKANSHAIEQLRIERDLFETQLRETSNEEQRQFQKKITDKELEINDLNNKIKEFQEIEKKLKTDIVEIENIKNEEITKLQENLHSIDELKSNEIFELKRELQDKTEFGDKLKSENEMHLLNIIELKNDVDTKNTEIETIQSKLDNSLITLEKQITQIEELQKDNKQKVTSLENNLRTVTTCKDEMIDSLKKLISEKDAQVISLNVEVKNLNGDVSKLEDELKETHAELEITKNEIITVKEEHECIVHINEKNLMLKNEELRALNEEISKLTHENSDVIAEKDKLLREFTEEKQILETKIEEMQESLKVKVSECETLQAEKEDIVVKLNSSNDELRSNAIIIADFEKNINALRGQCEELQAERAKEKADFVEALRKKEQDEQILEGRLQHAETSRLNAECELQDLLQHNTVMEADLAAAKRQLEEVRLELEKQTCKIVQTAGDTAVQVTDDALSALENGSAQEANRNAAQLAAAALETIAKHKQVKGNEDDIARSAVLAAHNAARLSAYVADICGVSTNLEASDKLSNQCRAMLSSTKQCLSSLREGVVPLECSNAVSMLRDVVNGAVAMDGAASGTRSVDDELADMDNAIEQAAEQIEELLKASRAGDSGVKLEVNEKILDACTTLMGAVKILVQDARKLQNELGDPNTRMKMYRRNPQWSEGLISAAKAVVFAAKLLVTSADEAVGTLGRVEGVSAAAHEVAGSTAQLVAASRARAPPASTALARLTAASRNVAAATGAVVAAVRAGSKLHHEQDALDTSALSLTATRRLEMESKVRALELETALDNERARLAALRKRHYQLAQHEENGNMTNGKQ